MFGQDATYAHRNLLDSFDDVASIYNRSHAHGEVTTQLIGQLVFLVDAGLGYDDYINIASSFVGNLALAIPNMGVAPVAPVVAEVPIEVPMPPPLTPIQIPIPVPIPIYGDENAIPVGN